MTSHNQSRKMNLKSFDKALLMSMLLVIILTIIQIIGLKQVGDGKFESLGWTVNVYRISKVLFIVSILIFAYTIYARGKKGQNLKTLSNIMTLAGLISYLLYFIGANSIFKSFANMLQGYKNLMGNNLGGAFASAFSGYNEISNISSAQETFVSIFMILSPVLLAVAAYLLYKKIYNHVDRKVGGNTTFSTSKIQDNFKKTKETFNQKFDEMKADNIDDYDVESPEDLEATRVFHKNEEFFNEDQEDVDDYRETYDDDNDSLGYEEEDTYSSDKRQNKNTDGLQKAIKIGGIIVAIVILALVGKFALDKSKPDAVVDTSEINIELDVTGVDGYGTAEALVTGDFILKDVKEDVDRYALLEYLESLPVEVNKTEKLKNGDEVTAILKLEKGDYKIKFDQEEIKQTAKVEGLPKLINGIKTIPSETLSKIDSKIKKEIQNYVGDSVKNLKIEQVRLYEELVDEESIANIGEDAISPYNLVYLYQVEYDTSYDHVSRIFVYNVSEFSERNGVVIYDLYQDSYYDSADLEDLENNLKYGGYTEVPDFRKEVTPEKTVNKEEEAAEEAAKEAEKQAEATAKMKKLAEGLVNSNRTIKDKGNIRVSPNLNADVVVQLNKGDVVHIYDTVISGERIWCQVEAGNENGDYYSGWISNRVLDI